MSLVPVVLKYILDNRINEPQHLLSRVPCIGEEIYIEGRSFTVTGVLHTLDADPDLDQPCAIVMLR